MNPAHLTFVHALSPLHAGTGQGVGVIDLPVAREKATNLPFLPGSTLKGSLRDECENNAIYKSNCESVFGKGGDDASSYAGSAVFTDQRLLCLPVRSLLGTFAWATSPFILERFRRDAENIKLTGLPRKLAATKQSCIVASRDCEIAADGKVFIEDLDLTVQTEANADDWANWLAPKIFPAKTQVQTNPWQAFFKNRFCIVSDDAMSFLAETATQITARNSLDDDTKVTKKGALWYEESLPAETILSGMLVAVHVQASSQMVFETVKSLTEKPVQLGGGLTVGRGICQISLDYAKPAQTQNGGSENANP